MDATKLETLQAMFPSVEGDVIAVLLIESDNNRKWLWFNRDMTDYITVYVS